MHLIQQHTRFLIPSGYNIFGWTLKYSCTPCIHKLLILIQTKFHQCCFFGCLSYSNIFVGFEVLTAVVIKSAIFWNITPCSPLSGNRRSEEHITCHLLSGWFLAQLIFSALKMEAICSSETSVDTQWTIWDYTLEQGSPNYGPRATSGPRKNWAEMRQLN
jgi:hypothetical protein